MCPIAGRWLPEGQRQGDWFNESVFRAVAHAGGTCVRIDASWDRIEPERGRRTWTEFDRTIGQIRRAGLEPIALVVNNPLWAVAPGQNHYQYPPTPEALPVFEDFCRELAERFRDKITYYEIWNEENGVGWHEFNRADEFAPMLQAAHRGLKAGNPKSLIAVGGLDPNWRGFFSYVEALYKHGAGDAFEAVALHPYNHGPVALETIRDLRRVLLAHDDAEKTVWLTEYGWPNNVSEETRARWMKESIDALRRPEFDYVTVGTVLSVVDFEGSGFGLCAPPLRPRPIYHVFYNYGRGRVATDPPPLVTCEAIPETALPLRDGNFEGDGTAWTAFGDTDGVREALPGPAPARTWGKAFGAAQGPGGPRAGGAYQRLPARDGEHVRASVFVLTRADGDRGDVPRCRIGLDPAGGTDPKGARVRWSDWNFTHTSWMRIEVGQIEPLAAEGDHVTVFLEHRQGAAAGQLTLFDEAACWSYPPERLVVPMTSPAGDDILLEVVPEPPAPAAPPPAPEGRAVFSANLERDAVDAWEKPDGQWDVVAGILTSVGGTDVRTIQVPAALPDDDWTLDVEIQNVWTLDLGIWFGKVGGASGPDTALLVLSNWWHEGNCGFQIWGGGPVDERGKWRGSATVPIAPGGTYTVRVARKGRTLEASLDGRPLGVLDVSDFSVAACGFYQGYSGYGGVRKVAVHAK